MIYCYNCKIEDFSSKPNNVYIGRGSVLGNPYTHDGKKSSLARLSFPTREEAINAYKLYFNSMYENDMEFKLTVDGLYEKYKNIIGNVVPNIDINIHIFLPILSLNLPNNGHDINANKPLTVSDIPIA